MQKAEKVRVLLVEDEPIQQMVTREILESFQCKVDIAESGKKGLAKLKKEKYDIVLTDNNLGDITGCEMTVSFREYEIDHHRKRIPIIGLSSMVNKENEKVFIESGMDMIFKKPISVDTIDKILKAFTR